MKPFRSLRAQLAASAAVLVLLIVAASGFVIVLQMDARDRALLDAQLESRLTRVGEDIAKITSTGTGQEAPTDSSDTYGDLLTGSESLVRLIEGTDVIAQRGEIPDEPIPVALTNGFSTITVDGQPWRSVVGADSSGDVRIQVLQSLTPFQQRLEANTLLVTLVTAIATVMAVLGGWLVARLVLQPLERLTRGASAIRAERDIEYRLPAVTTPQEVAELSDTLNDMLERLQRGMLSTRRFTADAGHELRTPLASLGAYLEILRRNPTLSTEQRGDLVTSATAEHRRIVDLLEGLQTLARGDAEALPARESVDLVDVAGEAVIRARRRHPAVAFTFHSSLPEDAGTIEGWHEGVRLALDNLLNNAAVHGRREGTVVIDLTSSSETYRLTVSDDGPGIPVEHRAGLTERFARGIDAKSEGSGLGLALVEQQASLHGGTLTLGTSSLGGLAATLHFPLPRP